MHIQSLPRSITVWALMFAASILAGDALAADVAVKLSNGGAVGTVDG